MNDATVKTLQTDNDTALSVKTLQIDSDEPYPHDDQGEDAPAEDVEQVTVEKPKQSTAKPVERNFVRGGKVHQMKTNSIGRKKTTKQSQSGGWFKRFAEACVSIKRADERREITVRDAYEVGLRAASTLARVLPRISEKERVTVMRSLEGICESHNDECTASTYKQAGTVPVDPPRMMANRLTSRKSAGA